MRLFAAVAFDGKVRRYLSAVSEAAKTAGTGSFSRSGLYHLTLGALHSSISTQLDFTYDHHARMEKGIGRLVDADMNEDSARMKAAEMKTQLATMALQIANADHRNILQLFRN